MALVLSLEIRLKLNHCGHVDSVIDVVCVVVLGSDSVVSIAEIRNTQR